MLSRAELEALVIAFTDAFNREDLDGVMAFLADDAVYDQFDGVRAVGKAAIREAFVPQFRGDYGTMRFVTEDLFVDAHDGEGDDQLALHARARRRAARLARARPPAFRGAAREGEAHVREGRRAAADGRSGDAVNLGATRAQPSRLVGAGGAVRYGVFDAAIDVVNHDDFVYRDPFGKPRGRLARHFGFHQFQFLGGLSERLVFGCAIIDTRYVSTAFVYCYDPATRRRVEHSVRRPLGMGVTFVDTPEVGTVSFTAGRRALRDARRRVAARAPARSRRRAHFDRRDVQRGDAADGADAPLHPRRCHRLGLRAEDRRPRHARHAPLGRHVLRPRRHRHLRPSRLERRLHAARDLLELGLSRRTAPPTVASPA